MARLADEDPEFVAIACGEAILTRRELERRSNQMARVYAERGVRLGDYVTIALPNGIDFYVAFFATLKVGAVPMPLSYRLPAAERQAILELAKPALLVGVAQDGQEGYPSLPAGYQPASDVSSGPLAEVVSPSWKAPASGGSTGRPKIIRNGTGAEGSPALLALAYQYGPSDIQAVVGPLYHNMSLASSIGGLLQGQHLVVMDRFDADELLRLVGKHRITWLILVPTMLHRMYRAIEDGGSYDLSSIRLIWHMASKCPEWLKEEWIELVGPEKIMELYGGTESIAISMISGDEWLQHRGSVGRPVIGYMVVLDASGTRCPRARSARSTCGPPKGRQCRTSMWVPSRKCSTGGLRSAISGGKTMRATSTSVTGAST
jgi:bile acid-coenzyme A ligase